MSDSNAMMATSYGISGVSSLAGAYSQSQAMKAQGDYQRQMANLNARMADMQAEDALKRGSREATEHKKKVKQLVGSQRAAMASQGIALDSGSALDIQEETISMGAEDALTIKNNAWREAWGYRSQGEASRYEGEVAKAASRNQARNTLITGGLQATAAGLQAGYWAGKGGKETVARRKGLEIIIPKKGETGPKITPSSKSSKYGNYA